MRASRWSFVDWGISMREGIGGKREAKSGAPERDAASRVFDVGAISLCGCVRGREGCQKTGLGGAAGKEGALTFDRRGLIGNCE